MSPTTAIAIYFLIWWLTLFVVLPWGIRSQHENGEMAAGTDPGAPVLSRLLPKLVWTTVAATAVFSVAYWLYVSGILTLDLFPG